MPAQKFNSVKISEAAKLLRVSTKTLRRWEKRGILVPQRTQGNQRLYLESQIDNFVKPKRAFQTNGASPGQAEAPMVSSIASRQEEVSSEVKPFSLSDIQRTVIHGFITALILTSVVVVSEKTGLVRFDSIKSRQESITGALSGYKTAVLSPYEKMSKFISLTQGNIAYQKASEEELRQAQVLAAEDAKDFTFDVSVPGLFQNDVEIQGNLTAPNVVYSITGGENVTITGDAQTPTISVEDVTADLDVFKTVKVGTTTFEASGLEDTLTFAGGSNVSLSLDTTNKKLTISSTDNDTTGGWTDDGTIVRLSTATDLVSIGSATGSAKLAILGNDNRDLFTASASGDLVLKLSNAGLLNLSATGFNAGLRLQNATTLFSGAGVPSDSNGANGDYYFRTDGTGNSSVYTKVSGIWTPAGGATTTLQDAYDNDANGSDVIVAFTSSDDSIILRNPASSGTDSSYLLNLDQLATGAVDALTVSNAGTGVGASFTLSNISGVRTNGILIDQTGAGTTTNALNITETAGTISTGINIGAGVGTGINLNANTLVNIGNAGTDFDSSGGLTLADNLAVNGGSITSTSSFTLTPTTTLSLNSTGDMTLDSSTDIILDADGADVFFKDATTTFVTFTNSSTDLTLDIAGGNLNLADGDVVNIGGLIGALTYNSFAAATDAPDEAGISADNDLYIGGDLEVDGTIYGGVTGTVNPGFTEGSVVFINSTGALAQDNTNFFWDDTSNELGIGTNSPGAAIDNLTTGSATSAFTGDNTILRFSQTWTGASSPNNTGNILDISRAITMSAGAQTLTQSGALATFASSGSESAGDISDTSNILSLAQNCGTGLTCTGAVLKITNAGTGADIALDNDETITNSSDGTITFGSDKLTLTTAATAGNLFTANYAGAATQTAALLGLVVDISTNVTVPNSALGNQSGLQLTIKDGGSSATGVGIEIDGTYDRGIDLSGATLSSGGGDIFNDTSTIIDLGAVADNVLEVTNSLGNNTNDNIITLEVDANTDASNKILLRVVSNVGGTETTVFSVDSDGDLTGGTFSGVDLSCSNCLDYVNFEDTMDLDTNLVLNQTTFTWGQTFTGDTTVGQTYTANSLTTGTALRLTSSGIITSGGEVLDLVANGLTTGNVITSSATALTSGSLLAFTGPSGGTVGAIGSVVSLASDLGDAGKMLSSTATIDSTAVAASSYNIYASTVNSNGTNANTAYGVYSTLTDAVSLGNTNYGLYSNVSNTGANTSGTKNVYGLSSLASNLTGGVGGASNTYAGYFSATGDTGGTSTAYGIYATVTGANTNYSGIFTGGNFGIGTTAPDAALEINHATGDSLRLTYNDANGSATNFTDFSLDSTGGLTVTGSAASVASGTSAEKTFLTLTPATITLTGTTQVTSLMDTYLLNRATIAGDTATVTVDDAATLTIAGPPAEGSNVALTEAYGLKINTAATTATTAYGLYVDAPTGAGSNYGAIFNTGNVGIGTSTPTNLLQVSGSVVIPLKVTGSNVSATGINIDNTTAGGIEWVLYSNGSSAGFGPAGSLTFRDADNNLNALTILPSSGNVGIGTTAPDAALEINHATGDSLRLTYNDSNGSAVNYTDFSLSATGELTLTGSAATLGASATAEKTFLTLTPGTITLTAPTTVTSLMETAVLTGATIAADASTTVNKATTLSLVAPVDSTNATLTDDSALRIINVTSGAGVLTNQYGLYIEDLTSGATADYGIYIAGADTYALYAAADDIATLDNLWVGATAETIANGTFALDGNDAFISGTLGVEGIIYTDGGLDVNNGSFIIDSAGTTLTCTDCINADDLADNIDLTAASETSLTFTTFASNTIVLNQPTAAAGLLDVNASTSTSDVRGIDQTLTFTGIANTNTTYGIANSVTQATALGTTVGQTYYGIYSTLTKSGADTTSGTINAYGMYSTVSNTETGGGAASTRNTYAGYFTATGDTDGTGTAVGVYGSATGADFNYAGIFEAGNVGVGDTSPDYLLELHDATLTPAFALSDDDIIHGVTTLAETDVFYHLSSLSTTDGGAQLTAFADNVNTAQALSVRGILGNTPDDTVPAIKLVGAKGSGTGIVDLAAAETVFQVANNDDTAALSIVGSGATTINTSLTITGTEGSTVSTITAGDAVISDGSLAITDDDNAVSLSLINNTANTIGASDYTTGLIDFDSTSLTTGALLNLNASALTTGRLLNAYSTSTALTTGSLGIFNWEPSAPATASGDLFRINIGAAGDTTGNLFNVTDSSSSLFSVSTTAITSALPHSFTAAGDVSVAYDLVFTNQTASYIKSNAPLYIEAGETFESNNLNLNVYNSGRIVNTLGAGGRFTIDGSTNSNTTGAWPNGVLDLSVTTATNNTVGLSNNYTVSSGAATSDQYGSYFSLTQNDADANLFGFYIHMAAVSTTIADGNLATCMICIINSENQAGAIRDAILIDSFGATAGAYTNGINIDTTDVTTDIVLQFGETIDNNVDGVVDISAEVLINLDGGAVTTEALCGNQADGDAGDTINIRISDCSGAPSSDYMEMYSLEENIETGDVVAPSSNYITTSNGSRMVKLAKSTASYQKSVIGIASDPETAGDFNSIGYNINEEDNPKPVALSGRVYVKIDSSSLPITPGDYITTSDTPGKAMKATQAGQMIGKALEDWDPLSGIEKILVFVTTSWADPNQSLAVDENGNVALNNSLADRKLEITNSQDLSFKEISGGIEKFAIDSSGNTYLGNLETSTSSGSVCYQSVIRNGSPVFKLVACDGSPADLAEFYPTSDSGEIPEPGDIVSVGNPLEYGEQKTFLVEKSKVAYDSKAIGIVSTKAWKVIGEDVFEWAQNAIAVALIGRVPVKISSSSDPIEPGDLLAASSEPGKAMKATGQGYTLGKALEAWTPDSGKDKILAFIDNSVNLGSDLASIPSSSTSSGISEPGSDVSLASIQELLAGVSQDQNLLKEAVGWKVDPDTNAVSLTEIGTENLYVTQTAAIQKLFIQDSIVTGSNLILSSTDSVNFIDSTDKPLEIQATASYPLSIMAGKVKIDTEGNVDVSGNLRVAGTVSAAKIEVSSNNLVQEAEAQISEIETNGSAGNSVVTTGVISMTIRNSSVTEKSLIYLTPTSPTFGNTLFLKGKTPGEFIVGFEGPVANDVSFNWLIIN